MVVLLPGDMWILVSTAAVLAVDRSAHTTVFLSVIAPGTPTWSILITPIRCCIWILILIRIITFSVILYGMMLQDVQLMKVNGTLQISTQHAEVEIAFKITTFGQ